MGCGSSARNETPSKEVSYQIAVDGVPIEDNLTNDNNMPDSPDARANLKVRPSWVGF